MAVPAELRRNASLVAAAGLAFAVLLVIATDFATPLAPAERAALRPLADRSDPWRGLGIGVIGLPVSTWDAPLWVVRGYFIAVSSLSLVASFRRWARPAGKVAWTAALLFAASWVPLATGGGASPDLLAALSAVLAAGFAMRWCVERDRGALVGIGGGVALTAVFVPLSGIFAAMGLTVVLVVWARGQSLPGVISAATGLVVGLAPWLIESVARFDGVLARLRESIDPGADVLAYLRLVDGPLRGDAAGPSVPGVVWLLALGGLVATGILQKRWNHRRNASLVGVTVSAALLVPYVFLVAPPDVRLLLPAYGLLVVAAAAGVLDLWHIVGRVIRFPLVTLALVVVTGAALVWQVSLAITHG